MVAPSPRLPTGTVTFLRTDVEGSMRLARALGSEWDGLNTAQLDIVRRAVARHGGTIVRTEGDALFAVFSEARAAARAAVECQRSLADHPWPAEAPVRVRIGLHSGEAHLAGDDYGGFDVNRAARVAAVGHGGQIVLSDPTRALIAGDLGPGESIRDLGRHPLKDVPHPEHLFQLEAPGLATSFPPVRTAAPVVGNVPARLTSLVGREPELESLSRLLGTSRLLTITGPGGVGKTSLALELARRQAPAFADGAWMVALDEIEDPALVLAAVARVLGVWDGPARPVLAGLARHLETRETLLVLDNFEHVLAAARDVAQLLAAAEGLRIIVTSRAALRVRGEQEVPVGPLDHAGTGMAEQQVPAAVRLFEERARAVRPGWGTGVDPGIVREICERLDGLPLAIELAAARVSVLSAAAIRDRLAARLPLPGPGPRDAPDRQRTLDGAIAWSYDLLDEADRALLRDLAVFEGGFDLEQAAIVAGQQDKDQDELDAIALLVDHSLLGRDDRPGHDDRPGAARYRMLETIRSFMLRRAGEDVARDREVRGRHARAFLALAEEAAQHFLGSDQPRWLDRLAEDDANLRAAVQWAIAAGEVELAQRLSAALWRYWQLAGHLTEGRALADAVLELPGAEEATAGRLWSLAAAGGMAYWQGEAARADALYRRQLEASLAIGDRPGEADALFNLASTAFILGSPAESRDLLDMVRSRYVDMGDERGAIRTDWGRANLLLSEGRPVDAIALLRAARERYLAHRDMTYVALASGSLSFAHLVMGNRIEALRWGRESLVTYHRLRDIATTTITLPAIAVYLVEFERHEAAAVAMGAYEALREVHGVEPPAGFALMIQALRPLERVMDVLRSDRFEAAVQHGRQLSLDQAVAYALDAIAGVEASEQAES
jgi:predicted ATPase/class 3 adenylate cyclase